MSLTEIIEKIKVNMCRSLVASPCTEEELVYRPFLKNVSSFGVQHGFKMLLRENLINEDSKGILTVKKQYVKKYSQPVENVF